MSNITRLVQRMRTAAKKATPGQWVEFTDTASVTFSVHTPDDARCGNIVKWTGFDGQRRAKANAEFIALVNPANILALVEVLEKAQGMEAYWKTQCRGITDHCEELQARIADLELRHRQRDRDDFIRGITHPASMYTADEAMEVIAEYDRTH
ncbi:TPA: ead/Ea22-like family protein [Klebsiella quasipneumoniae]|nr:ead/Ea22-like family protein [Klebsiella quasipneumoniae]